MQYEELRLLQEKALEEEAAEESAKEETGCDPSASCNVE